MGAKPVAARPNRLSTRIKAPKAFEGFVDGGIVAEKESMPFEPF